MKRNIAITTILVILAFVGRAQDTEMLMKQANDFYAEKEYSKAIKNYEQIIDMGLTSAELHFNLANAYYKSNKIAPAILHYEKAKKLAPNDEDIEFNLKIANLKTTDKVDEIPQILVSKWFDNFTASYHTNTWAIISIATFLLFISLLLVFMLSANSAVKKLVFPFAVLFLIVSATSFSFSYKEKQELLKEKEAIVFTPAVTVKSTPNESGTNLFVIHEGLKVDVVENNGEWCEIRLKNGKKGWLKRTDIQMI